jgi:hypothetical protein
MLRTLFIAPMALLLVVPQTPGQGNRQNPDAPKKPFTMAQVWTLDATYTDQQHGVTFRYPSIWEATTQFAYHPPALTESVEAKSIVGFGYSEGGFPRDEIVGPYSGTNLEGFGLVFSVVSAESASECEIKATSLSESDEHTRIVLGHRSFSVHETGEAGMSQSISGTLYVTYAGHFCYLFETDMAVASPGVLDDIRPLTTAQSRFIDKRLLDIMKSVRIVPN